MISGKKPGKHVDLSQNQNWNLFPQKCEGICQLDLETVNIQHCVHQACKAKQIYFCISWLYIICNINEVQQKYFQSQNIWTDLVNVDVDLTDTDLDINAFSVESGCWCLDLYFLISVQLYNWEWLQSQLLLSVSQIKISLQ